MSQIGHGGTRVGERSTIRNWATESQEKTDRDRETCSEQKKTDRLGEDVFFIRSFTRHGDLERYHKMGTGWEKKMLLFWHLHIDLGDLWFLLFQSAFNSLFATPLLPEGSPFGQYLSFLLFLFPLLFFLTNLFIITVGLADWSWIPHGRAISKKGLFVVSCWRVFPCTISVLMYKTIG